MGDNVEDCEMDDSFIIHRPRVCTPSLSSEDQSLDMPTTPPNASTSSAELCLTPEPRRMGVDRNLFTRQKLRFTSTPFFMNRLSNTMPNQLVPKFPLADTKRQCQSALNIKLPTIGPEEIPVEYVNPFTPDGKMLVNKVKAHNKLVRLSINPNSNGEGTENSLESEENSEDICDIDMPSRSRLSEFNVSRFNEEFITLCEIGKGHHGCVFKCLNRMNGCIYAIKRTIKPVRSSSQERLVRNEIYAHGVLDHPNIVRNYSCWKEEEYVFIQNEYCSGGSLETYVETNVMTEAVLRSLLLQMGNALKYMHKKGLAHLDVKPGNIFLSIDTVNKENSVDADGAYDEEKSEGIIFKLGDLGHITKLDEKYDVEEGDCRYLPREIIQEKFKQIDRADIFSLGLTVYEVAGGGPLPKNGEPWQELRDGNLKYLEQHSKEFNDLIKTMTQPDVEKRPSAAELVEMVKPSQPSTTNDDVMGFFYQYRNNTALIGHHTVEKAECYMKAFTHAYKSQKQMLQAKEAKKRGAVAKTRIVGKKTKRSTSTTLF